MSDILVVAVEGVKLDMQAQREFESLFRIAALKVAAQSTIDGVRLVTRFEFFGTAIEPFLGAASFWALLNISKKRQGVLAQLSTLVECAFHFSARVSVIAMAEGRPLPQCQIVVTAQELLQLSKLRLGSWLRVLRKPELFHFPQVEAKLLQPMRLESGQIATHYFQEFWIRAPTRERACDYVRLSVAGHASTVVDFGKIELAGPESPEVLDGEVERSGRVFFSEFGS